MRGSLAWEKIRGGYLKGAVLAGCSAGAMALGSYTASIRAVMSGSGPAWVPALGLLPGLITIPHFDRMAGYAGPAVFHKMLEAIPEGGLLVGVDEDTALVRGRTGEVSRRWRVMGRQTVSVYRHGVEPIIYRSGDYVPLAELTAEN
jgi:cyanophycinase-like exopeptidase